MNRITIPRLYSGGLITNYYCTSTCRHCLYACSPRWEKRYVTGDMAMSFMRKIKAAGCRSLHIGGGEPFLDFKGLVEVAKSARLSEMRVDYVETNSSWYTKGDDVAEWLEQLTALGVGRLLLSISPFHNEFIPFEKVKRLMETCRKCGMGVFPWVMDFYGEVNSFDETGTHSLEEYGKKYGSAYFAELPQRYWTYFGGRAVQWYKNILPCRSLDEIKKSPPCREVTDTSHFHADLFGNYLPGLCAGFSVAMDDISRPLSSEQYPLLTMLFNKGVAALLEHAQTEYGFVPEGEYLTKCHLCNAIRLFPVNEKHVASAELQPREYYSRLPDGF